MKNKIKSKLKCNIEDIDVKLDELLKASKENSDLQKDIQKSKINVIFEEALEPASLTQVQLCKNGG